MHLNSSWNNSAVSGWILKIFCMDTQWVVPNFFVFGFGGVRGGRGGFQGGGGVKNDFFQLIFSPLKNHFIIF